VVSHRLRPELRPEVRAELARDLEGWIDRLGLRAATEVTNEVLRRRRRRGHPFDNDDWLVVGMKLLLAQDNTLTPWAATAAFASGISESSRHSMRKRLLRKYRAQERQFLKRYPNGTLSDIQFMQALEDLDEYTKGVNQWCLDHGIGSEDRLSILETFKALRTMISWRAVDVLPTGEVIPRGAVIYTPEVTPDGKVRITFRGSSSALDRTFTLLKGINE
jgi:hypothetical protein